MQSKRDSGQLKHFHLKEGGVDYVPFYEADVLDQGFGSMDIALMPPISYTFNNKRYDFPTPTHLYWAIRCQDLPDFEIHLQKILTFQIPEQVHNSEKLSVYVKKILGNGLDDVDKNYEALVRTIYARSRIDELFRKQLSDSGDAYLVYDAGNPVTGNGDDGQGQNLRGKAMMEVREFLKKGSAIDNDAFKKSFEQMRKKAHAEMRELSDRIGEYNFKGASIPALAMKSQRHSSEETQSATKEEILTQEQKPQSPASIPTSDVQVYKFKGGSVTYLPIFQKSGLGALDSPVRIRIERELHQYQFPTPSHYYGALQLQHTEDYAKHFRAIEGLKTRKDVNNYVKNVLSNIRSQDPHWSEEKAYGFLVQTYYARTENDKNFIAQLMSSGDAYIVHDNASKRWGAGVDGQGDNLRGKALMEARERVRLGNDQFEQSREAFDKNFENLRKKAREERQSLDEIPAVRDAKVRIPTSKLYELSQNNPILIKKKAPVPFSSKEDRPMIQIPILSEEETQRRLDKFFGETQRDKDKEGAQRRSTRIIQDETDPEPEVDEEIAEPEKEEKISSSGPRINLLHPKNLKKIEESLESNMYKKSIKHEKSGNDVIFRVASTRFNKDSSMRDTNHSLRVHKHMLSTTDNDVETFKMMIIALEKVHGLSFQPKVMTQDEATRQKWLTAFRELRIYPNPEKFVHINTQVHEAVHEERETSTRRLR